jgi:DUF4097 and DUF4098 domain-containing protein YvlB
MLRTFPIVMLLATSLAAAGSPQSSTRTQAVERGCQQWNWNGDRASHCEVREATIPNAFRLDVDAGRNGGIRVHGWDRGEAQVRAIINAWASTDAAAQQLVGSVRIETAGGVVRADGPDTTDGQGWAVSFELQVPRTAMLMLQARNGGISLDDVQGTAEFQTRNGGINLHNVGGDIRGTTVNGGVRVDLDGDRWNGTGLDVATTNGGIQMALPANYSAQLEIGTTHGGLRIDFPMTVQGTINRYIATTIGAGGPRLRAMTTNGGVRVQQK